MTSIGSDLQKAIHLMKKDSTKEPLFFEALYRAKLLCPVQADVNQLPRNADGSIVLNADTPISIVSIANSSGDRYLVAFTDQNEHSKWDRAKDQQTVTYTFDDYRNLLLSGNAVYQGVVINPFSDNIVLGKKLFIDGNAQHNAVRNNESVMIGQPKDYPARMVEALRQYFRKVLLVRRAFLLWMVRGQEAGYLLVLEAKGSPQRLFPQIGEICEPYLRDKPLDIISLDTAFGQSAVENQEPFYKA